MKEQLKAEAYVRKQRPALMELSFGCEIKRFEHTPKEYFIGYRNDKALIYRDGGKTFCDQDELTIIGHPINLQDWLAVLGAKEPIEESTITPDLDMVVQWESSCMTFNLTTGQPATEGDFKAFNEIVSV